MGIVWILGVVGHGIVDVSALMIEQLGIGNHCCVLKVFAKAAGD